MAQGLEQCLSQRCSINVEAFLLGNQCQSLRSDPETSASAADWVRQALLSDALWTPSQGLSPSLVLAGSLEERCELTG